MSIQKEQPLVVSSYGFRCRTEIPDILFVDFDTLHGRLTLLLTVAVLEHFARDSVEYASRLKERNALSPQDAPAMLPFRRE